MLSCASCSASTGWRIWRIRPPRSACDMRLRTGVALVCCADFMKQGPEGVHQSIHLRRYRSEITGQTKLAGIPRGKFNHELIRLYNLGIYCNLKLMHIDLPRPLLVQINATQSLGNHPVAPSSLLTVITWVLRVLVCWWVKVAENAPGPIPRTFWQSRSCLSICRLTSSSLSPCCVSWIDTWFRPH